MNAATHRRPERRGVTHGSVHLQPAADQTLVLSPLMLRCSGGSRPAGQLAIAVGWAEEHLAPSQPRRTAAWEVAIRGGC